MNSDEEESTSTQESSETEDSPKDDQSDANSNDEQSMLNQKSTLREFLFPDDEDEIIETAISHYMQQRYVVAEKLLRKLLQKEKIVDLGYNSLTRARIMEDKWLNKIKSKDYLARTLFGQERYNEAEQLFREILPEQSDSLGINHEATIGSDWYLALIAHEQQQYSDAEQSFRELIPRCERALGRRDERTLSAKHMLASCLYLSDHYNEAESICQSVVQAREKTLGPDDEVTLESKYLLQRIHDKLVSSTAPATESTQNTSSLRDFFPRKIGDPYTDLEILEIARLLRPVKPEWSNIVRTYIVLRNIDCLSHIDTFIDAGFSDYWFPVTEKQLPESLNAALRFKFVAMQGLIMTNSMDLEKKNGRHCYFSLEDPLPFEVECTLGSGHFGEVHKIVSSISKKEYARKQILRSTIFQGNTEHMKFFIGEITLLQRLWHRHIVEFVGSYTDPQYIALIMSPVAEMDLEMYLECVGEAEYEELRAFFGCLTTGLAYLHKERVRHKDIKPGNILVHQGNVLLTDFGLSFDFENAQGSTTKGTVNAFTKRYCAPEVMMWQPRSTSSDIWSLGVVFLEMMVVLKGRTVKDMYEFLLSHGQEEEFPSTNTDGVDQLLKELQDNSEGSEKEMIDLIQAMLLKAREKRPEAGYLRASIIGLSRDRDDLSAPFCGKCCMLETDNMSDSDDEFFDLP